MDIMDTIKTAISHQPLAVRWIGNNLIANSQGLKAKIKEVVLWNMVQ